MRTLLLFRGAPGCGKSTYIDSHGLRPYALSADEIRLQCQGPQLTVDGSVEISQKSDKIVWDTLFKLLDTRMRNGEFTVIDATNSKSTEFNRYKEMCDHYRYRMFCIDLTSLPIEECKRRNANREPLKRVPEASIDKMYARFENQKIPAGIKVISEDELDSIWMHKFDMNKYKKIVHIGNINGCYTALMEYFKNGINDDYLYIFCGNLIGNGVENAEVIKFMLEIYKKPNIYILEAPNSRYLWLYANGGTSRSAEFEITIKPQLINANIDVKTIRQLYRKFGQYAWYSYAENDYVVSAGNLSAFLDNPTFISTNQIVNGVGKDDQFNMVAESWVNNTSNNIYHINSRRNMSKTDIKVNDRVFNLDNSVDYGGNLRILEIDENGFNIVEITNTVFKAPEVVEAEKQITSSSITDIVLKLRKNRYIREKEFGNISSFNFTNNAFYDSVWDEQTVVARGLYINTATMKIIARGFNKFFNIGERPETKLEMLQYSLTFPVTCYVKENGYLGLVSYNSETDDLFITSKSDPTGDYAIWLRDMINRKMTSEAREKLKQFSKKHNVTFVFESVDVKNDPHIIEYDDSELYLLAIINNDINFSQYDYSQLVEIGSDLGLKVKTKAVELKDWSEFYDWYNEVMAEDYEFDNRKIEGFVIEDANGFMVKAKLAYYKFWKAMRGVAHETIKNGYIRRTGMLTNTLSNEFYAFCQKLHNDNDKEQRELIPKDIIYLRNSFFKNKASN